MIASTEVRRNYGKAVKMGYGAMMAAKAMADGWNKAASPQDKNSKQTQSSDSQMLTSLYSRAMNEELSEEQQDQQKAKQATAGIGDKLLSTVGNALKNGIGKSTPQGPSL